MIYIGHKLIGNYEWFSKCLEELSLRLSSLCMFMLHVCLQRATEMSTSQSKWKRLEPYLLAAYAIGFYSIVLHDSLNLSYAFGSQWRAQRLRGLTTGWISNRFNDISDSQWRNFRRNLPILTLVMTIFVFLVNTSRAMFNFQGRGLSVLCILFSLGYLIYLHGSCTLFILGIVLGNFFLTKACASAKLFPVLIWVYNVTMLVSSRIFDGYSFSIFGQSLAFLDNHRGTFRWQICFNFVTLRMLSFSLDYHWAHGFSKADLKKHIQNCEHCCTGKSCYYVRQERSLSLESYSIERYMCYLFYLPLYIAGPIASFNAFSSQLDSPQSSESKLKIVCYGIRWIVCLLLIELITHFCYYNSLAVSDIWDMLDPWQIFIVGYGVLNFMWLKFLLIWRYFRLWALIGGIETPENMPRCINNCYDLEGFWRSWHASYNRWLIRYLYIPLGGSQRKMLNIWIIFTFVAIWHDLEWKLVSWAWVTCLFLVPEVLMKRFIHKAQVQQILDESAVEEVVAVSGAITISCLMIANLIGFVVGPTRMQWLISRMLRTDNLHILLGIFVSFYVGTKLMIYVARLRCRKI